FFISLDEAVQPGNVPIQGIRIALNGAEAPVGQAYGKLSTAITGADYDAATGQPLSMLGTVVPLEKGPEADEFFLTFDAIGGLAYARPPMPTPRALDLCDRPASADVRALTYEEINATTAAITGVDPNDPNVRTTYETVRQSLPAVATLEAELESHQVAIAQLAIEYCN